jgi:hypothetical protein
MKEVCLLRWFLYGNGYCFSVSRVRQSRTGIQFGTLEFPDWAAVEDYLYRLQGEM